MPRNKNKPAAAAGSSKSASASASSPKASASSSTSPSTSDPITLPTDTTTDAATSGSDKEARAMSDYEFIREGWGNKANFMRAHGLKPSDPEDRAMARKIIDEMREQAGLGQSPYRHAETGSGDKK